MSVTTNSKSVIRRDLVPEEVYNDKIEKISEKNTWVALNVLLALFTRVCFIGQIVFSIYYLVRLKNTYSYLGMISGGVIIIVDGLYVIIKRAGKEYSW